MGAAPWHQLDLGGSRNPVGGGQLFDLGVDGGTQQVVRPAFALPHRSDELGV